MHDSTIDGDEWCLKPKVVVVPYCIVIYIDSDTRDVTEELDERAQIIVDSWAYHKILLVPIMWEGIVSDQGFHEAYIFKEKNHIVVLYVN